MRKKAENANISQITHILYIYAFPPKNKLKSVDDTCQNHAKSLRVRHSPFPFHARMHTHTHAQTHGHTDVLMHCIHIIHASQQFETRHEKAKEKIVD